MAAAAATLPGGGVPREASGALNVSATRGDQGSYEQKQRYKKYELIGQGAQKKVYRAFDDERCIEVAWNEVAVAELARFREKDQQRVFAEIRVLKQLKHKNIMALHDYWYDEKRLTLNFITEIFPDGTLRQYRRRHKHADLTAMKRWAWQILQGLVYLHGHNPPIIHRDLKCDNIFVTGSTGVVKIGDLGLVTLCKDLSAPQSVLGTPEFMAPELYEEKYDEKVDVYAFGMCLLELATMEYPYTECKNAAQIYKKVTQGIPPASVEKLASAELRDFITLCLRHDPSQRPEARQLLKHPFFEPIRTAAAAAACGSNGGAGSGGGAAPKLTLSPCRSLTAGLASEATLATAAAAASAVAGCAEVLSPPQLSRSASVGVPLSMGGGSGGGVDGALLGSIAAALAGGPIAANGFTSAPTGSIAAAAAGGGAPAVDACPMPFSQLQQVVSLGAVAPALSAPAAAQPAQPHHSSPMGAIAAALLRQESLGGPAALAAASAAAAAPGDVGLERRGSGGSSGSGEGCRSGGSSPVGSRNVTEPGSATSPIPHQPLVAAAAGTAVAAASPLSTMGPIAAAALQPGSFGGAAGAPAAAVQAASLIAAAAGGAGGGAGGGVGGAVPPPISLGCLGLGLSPGSIASALSPVRSPHSLRDGAVTPPWEEVGGGGGGCVGWVGWVPTASGASGPASAATAGRGSVDAATGSYAGCASGSATGPAFPSATLASPQQQQQSPQSPLSPPHSVAGSAGGAVAAFAREFEATWGGGAAELPALSSQSSPFSPQPCAPAPPPAVGSPSAAAIAVAAVQAAAAVMQAGSGSGSGFAPGSLSFHPHGGVLPSICEDNELNEDMMFGNEESNCRQSRTLTVEDDESEDGEAGGSEGAEGSGSGSAGQSWAGQCDGPAAAGAGAFGCRSQPVNLQVRSSGQAAAACNNMALSFAMSFTNNRGVRKKVGFQYDMLHDTASAIAVEMVENLSLNTAEAEAIAAMIQHEVSRFHTRQQQEQQEQEAPAQAAGQQR